MKKYPAILAFLLLPGCDMPPAAVPETYVQPVESQELLAGNLQPPPQVSTEVVTMSLTRREHLMRLADIVIKDPPSIAELGCSPSDMLCLDAKNVLEKGGVPVKLTGRGEDATLIYEYIVTSNAPPPMPAAAAPALMPSAAPAAPVSRLPAPSLLLQSTPR